MSSDHRRKSYSNPQIAVNHQNQTCKKAFYQFKTHSNNNSSSPYSSKSTPTNSNSPFCHLQIFKNRFMKGRYYQQGSPEFRSREVVRDLKDIGVTSPLGEGSLKSRHPSRRTDSVQRQKAKQKESKTVLNFFFSGKRGSNDSDESPCTNDKGCDFDDGQFRKSKSIMIIRKLAKRKEALAQEQTDRFSCEFLRKREVPIHHTQHHFNFKSKTQATSQTEQNNTRRTRKTIQDILRLQEALREEEKKAKEEEEPICTKYISYASKPRNHTQSSLFGRKVFNKPLKWKKEKKEEEQDLGPWKRSPSNDFDIFL